MDSPFPGSWRIENNQQFCFFGAEIAKPVDDGGIKMNALGRLKNAPVLSD
jgi:hypothetical protein